MRVWWDLCAIMENVTLMNEDDQIIWAFGPVASTQFNRCME